MQGAPGGGARSNESWGSSDCSRRGVREADFATFCGLRLARRSKRLGILSGASSAAIRLSLNEVRGQAVFSSRPAVESTSSGWHGFTSTLTLWLSVPAQSRTLLRLR